MRRLGRIASILLTGLIPRLPCPANAQDIPLRPGVRMRAWMAPPDSMVWTGYLVTVDDRLLVLRAVDSVPEMRLWLRRLERLEVNRGKNPLLTAGGPIAGAVLGALLAPALLEDPVRCDVAPDDPSCAYETPKRMIGAAAGAVLVGIVTSLLARDRWTELPPAAWVSAPPPGHALEIGARMRW